MLPTAYLPPRITFFLKHRRNRYHYSLEVPEVQYRFSDHWSHHRMKSTRDFGRYGQGIIVCHELSCCQIYPSRSQPDAGKHYRVFGEWAGSPCQRTESAPKRCSAIHVPAPRDEVGYEHDCGQRIAMRYGRGIAHTANGVGLEKHAENCRGGRASRRGESRSRREAGQDGREWCRGFLRGGCFGPLLSMLFKRERNGYYLGF